MRTLVKFPMDRNQKTPKLNSNLFCELLSKKTGEKENKHCTTTRTSTAQNITAKVKLRSKNNS